jgi:hypothetical protein
VTYFTGPTGTIAVYEHLHGVAMFAWLLLRGLQSFLIRTNRRPVHRKTGKLAYVLGPWIAVSTIVLNLPASTAFADWFMRLPLT